VAAYLLHLERVGFDGSPRFLGVDERGREVLESCRRTMPAGSATTFTSTCRPIYRRKRLPTWSANCDTPSRLAMFVDAYDLADDERQAFCDVAIDGATRSWHRMRANAEQLGGGWARMWAEGAGDRILRRRAWLLENRTTLELAMQ
jgi:hypothetical protein